MEDPLNSPGAKAAAEIRAACNSLNEDERKELREYAHGIYSDQPKFWAIVYEDADVDVELFTNEKIARKVFEDRKINWTCHLFKKIS